ncbi:MAG: helix-turn-helix domain-containing protein [Planctomycetaceae bacterium]|nr:helix-turn-helix domain-containing protein [Planctomycetaceae bacterium]
MKRNIKHTTRDRYLTPEEGAKYRAIRQQIEAEKPEIAARIRRQLVAISSIQKVFEQLREIRETKGLSLRDVQDLTGIDASALSKLERGERENFTVDTLVRYAQALGKQVAVSVSDG